MRSIILTIAALVALAGCVQVPPDGEGAAVEPAEASPPERIEGMTARETREDADVDCNDGGIGLPRACAERRVRVEGRIGIAHLPIDLSATNGAVVIEPSHGDAWSFEATYRVSDLTREMARDALDTAWSWSHEDASGHRLRAGPAPGASVWPIGPGVVVSSYVLRLPAWLAIDVHASTDNGELLVQGFQMGQVDVTTDNGAIVLSGGAANVRARTDNGAMTLELTPRGGDFDLATDNGQIVVQVPGARPYGYAIEATTDNGDIEIALPDGEAREREDGASFRTRGYDARAIRTTMTLATDNGSIVVQAA